MMLMNKVLRRIFTPQREEITEGWRKINKEVKSINLPIVSDGCETWSLNLTEKHI
jgi:hypothetical protein